MGPAQAAVGRVYEYTSFVFDCGFFLVFCLVFFYFIFIIFISIARAPAYPGSPGWVSLRG